MYQQVGLWLRIAQLHYFLGDHTKFLEYALAPMQTSLERERRLLLLAEANKGPSVASLRPLHRKYRGKYVKANPAPAAPADAIFVGCVRGRFWCGETLNPKP